jgi:hypothetical protein
VLEEAELGSRPIDHIRWFGIDSLRESRHDPEMVRQIRVRYRAIRPPRCLEDSPTGIALDTDMVYRGPLRGRHSNR